MPLFQRISSPEKPTAPPAPSASSGLFKRLDKPVTPAPQDTPLFKPLKLTATTTPALPKGPEYYSTTTPKGSIGFSNEKDVSGRPFLAYRKPGDTSTTTDKTRVATTFDPAKAQPVTRESYYNPRAADLRDKMKEEMGIAYSDELDHKIALALSGSNDKANLRSIPAEENDDSPIITRLQEEVTSGKKSLFEAQVELAKKKGIEVPWTTIAKDPSFWEKAEKAAHAIGGEVKEVLTHLKKAASGNLLPDVKPGPDIKVNTDQDMKDAKNQMSMNQLQILLNRNESIGTAQPGGIPATPSDNLIQQKRDLDPEKINIKVPFTTGTYVSLNSPLADRIAFGNNPQNLLNKGANFALNIPSDILQAIPRAAIIFKKELSPSTFGKPSTEKLSGATARLYGSDEYKNVVADMNERIERGDGFLSAAIGAASQKTLEIAFGASVLASTLTKLSKVLNSNDVNAQIEAWKTLGSPTTKAELDAAYRMRATQFHPDVTGGDDTAIKIINQAKSIIDKEGLPTIIDKARIGGAKYTEWAGRETPVKDIGNFFNPDLSVKELQPKAIPNAPQLPGYKDRNPGQPVGLSTKAVEPVGFAPKDQKLIESQINNHIKTADQILKDPDMAGTPIAELLTRTKTNIVDDLTHEGFKDVAEKISKLDVSTFKSVGQLNNAVQGLIKPAPEVFKGFNDITTAVLNRLAGRASVSKQFISDLTNSPDLKQAERDIIREKLADYPDGNIPVKEFADKVKAELLPLERATSGTEGDEFLKYEHITLPSELRGSVGNYSEHIYESPIKTSAGDVHFSDSTDNYFGHTRVEDMKDGTRRVIEVQSDLYQKGGLERENPTIKGNEFIPKNDQRLVNREKEISKLKQYNDPTAHFRMVREEIKQAAKDGKTKLQFPTGETAMKIEGLGDNTSWTIDGRGPMSVDELKVGEKVYQATDEIVDEGNAWVITDVLGDGKFKAVPAQRSSAVGNNVIRYEDIKNDPKERNSYRIQLEEAFDISGKVDTNNPIYKFYEKDLGKYVTNKFGAKRITDAKGVSWYELPVSKDMAEKPVPAFKKGQKTDYALKSGPKVTPAEMRKIIQSVLPEGKYIQTVFDKRIIEKGYWGEFVKDHFDVVTTELRPLIRLYEQGGKVSVRTGLHEAMHYLFSLYSPSLRRSLLEEALSKMTEKDHARYIKRGYETKTERAEEFIADQYAKMKANEMGYKSRIQSILDRIDAVLRAISGKAKKFFEDVKKLLNEKGSEGGYANFGKPEEIRPVTNGLDEVQSVFDEFKGMKKGDLIENPEGVVSSDVKINQNTRKIIGASSDAVSFKRLPIKHLAEKGDEGQALLNNVSVILESPNEIYKTGAPDRFVISKDIKVRNRPKQAVILEVTKKDGNIVVTAFKTNPQYLKKFDLLWRTPDAAANPLPISGPREETSSGRGDFSTITTDRSSQAKETISNESLKVNEQNGNNSVDEVRPDFKETEQGIKERDKVALREAKNQPTPLEIEVNNLTTERTALVEAINNHPARAASKYARNGALPEVLGEGGKFGKSGDQIAQELGYPSSEALRFDYQNYQLMRKRFADLHERTIIAKEKLAKARAEDKEAKSLGHLLEKTARKTDSELAKIEQLRRTKLAEEEGARAAYVEQRLKDTLQDKINKARYEAAKRRGILGKIRSALNPIKSLDKTSKRIVSDWFTKKTIAKQDAQQMFYEAFQKGPQNFQEIIDYQAGKQTPYIKETFDAMETDFKRRDLDFSHLDDYVPQVYLDSPKAQLEAQKRALKEKGLSDEEIKKYLDGEPLPEQKALRLKLRPNFVKTRFWPDYKTAMRHGLHPKYRTPAQLIAYYKLSGENAIANRELISELKQEAKLLTSDDAPDTWKPVTLRFSKEGLYAPPELADLINGKFRDETNLSIPQWIGNVAKTVSAGMQNMILSAGVPFTNINYFSGGQAYILLTTSMGEVATLQFRAALSSLNASFAYIRANSNTVSARWFHDNLPYLEKMAENGLDVSGNVGDFSFKTLREAFSDALESGPGIKNKLTGAKNAGGVLFTKAFGEKTFKSMMPQITVQIWKDTYNASLRKGLAEDVAERIATETTMAFRGMTLEKGRSETTKDALGSVLFAPPYRESLINILTSAGKSFSTEFKNPSFAKSRAFVVGLIITYALYNLLNKKLNGHYMWDNPNGRKLSLRIPRANGETIYSELGPSVMALPRAIAEGVIAAFKGDSSTAIQKAGMAFSMPIKIGLELYANKDYFGNPIWNETDSTATRIKKGAEHVGVAVNHPFIAQTYKYWAGKQPLHQSISYMLELPFKFSSLDKEAKSVYYAALRKKAIEEARAKEKIMPTYKHLQELKAEGKMTEANEIYEGLSGPQKAVYDSIKRSEKLKDTKARKALMQSVYDRNQDLIEEGRMNDAQAIYNGLSAEDQHAYDLIKKAAQKN